MAAIQQQGALLTTVASGVLLSAYFIWRRTRSHQDDDEEEWEPVSRDHVVKFFTVVVAHSHTQMAAFNQQIAQYRGKVPEQQLTDLAVAHFEDALNKCQQQILDSMGIAMEDMEDSSNYYEAQGDQQVKEQMKLLKHLYQAVSNAPAEEEVPELPSDLTAEKMVTVVNAFFSVSNTVIREVVEELISQGKNLSDPTAAMEMSMLLQQRSVPATDAALQRYKLDSKTIGPAMEMYRDSPEVQNAVRVGGEEQREILATYGLA